MAKLKKSSVETSHTLCDTLKTWVFSIMNQTLVRSLKLTLVDISNWNELHWLSDLDSFVNDTDLTLIGVSPFISRTASPTSTIKLKSCKHLRVNLSDEDCTARTGTLCMNLVLPKLISSIETLQINGIFPHHKNSQPHYRTVMDVSCLNGFRHLRQMELSNVIIQSKSATSLAPFLETLKLNRCMISFGILSQFFGSCLSDLVLKKCDMEIFDTFNSSFNLRTLIMEECKPHIFDCRLLAGLHQLSTLSLSNTATLRVDNIDVLEGMTSLEKIDLSGCNHYTFSNVEPGRDLSYLNIDRLNRLSHMNMDNVLSMNFQTFSPLNSSWTKHLHRVWFEVNSKLSSPINLEGQADTSQNISSIFSHSKFTPKSNSYIDLKRVASRVLDYLQNSRRFLQYASTFIKNRESGGSLTIDNVFYTQSIIHVMYSFRFNVKNMAFVVRDWMGSIKFLNDSSLTLWSAFDGNLSDKHTRESQIMFSMPVRSPDLFPQMKKRTIEH